MGSLNGDVMVMRNGRSTSQVSVYNYPEHLNPFYEDDQHKRLRFWKINKKDNEGRRNSFSIANLKDMWAFKSFRMKKKSSTLGINKTSESPPLLRRDYALDNGWNTFDHRLRASNTSSINGDNFQRNATYRSSLQTLPMTNVDRIGLNRNDGYRSTIQVPRSANNRYQKQQQQNIGVSQNRRYVYGGSITPQPLRISRSNIGRGPYDYDSDNAMNRGSSQSSMVSTNPFESDDDDNEDLRSGMRSVMNGSITTLTSRTPRKKRRAPAPPTPVHSRSNGVPLPTIRIDSSHDNTQDELHIKEEMDIANLTAEIESFVKTKSNDDIEETPKQENTSLVTTIANDSETLKATKLEASDHTANTVIITENKNNTAKESIHKTEKANGQLTVETVTESTITKTESDVIKPVENTTKVTKVSNEIETKIEENKDIKINGAIPKKPINNTVGNNTSAEHKQQPNQTTEELCIREADKEEFLQKPVPLKRHTKPETEVGHVECIHVHVESPKASPRQDHPNGLTSFKAVETVEAKDSITTKTPFVLTSPPTRKKQLPTEIVDPVRKETVKLIETNTKVKVNNELNIQEEHIASKPEISSKPVLSPKPLTREAKGIVQGYAEIHKPTRRHNHQGQAINASRDGSISPPFVPPKHIAKNEEEKINNTDQLHNNGVGEEKSTVNKPLLLDNIDSLKIVETTKSNKTNGDLRVEEKETYREQLSNNNSISFAADLKEEKNRDDEFDLLYRPKPVGQMEWKRSTLAPLETNIPPEKRKSVKDIIESINRSQRLLNAAANKDFPALQNQNTTTHQTSINHNNNNSILNEKQTSSTTTEDQAGAASSPSPSLSNDNNDNNEIFQKCKVNKEVFDYRETSPITSNLDWNPVPKPKRTKAAQE